jgi:hypothetical protein
MSYRLAEMLSSFASLASAIAIAVIGLACLRHRMRGGDKCFGIAAWVALLNLLLTCVLSSVWWAAHFLGSSGAFTSPGATFYTVLGRSLQIADGLWFVLVATFTAGVWRTARVLPRRLPDSCPERPAAQPLE